MPAPDPRPPAAIRLRPLHPGDAEALFALSLAIVAADRGVVLEPDELSLDHAEAQLQRFAAAGPDGLLLGAEAGGRLLGTVDLLRHRPRRLRHGALLTLGVHPDAQGQGLGRRLLEAGLGWADALEITRVELFVLADNHRAIALYRSAGFAEEGRRRGFCRGAAGALVDDLTMARRRPGAG